MANSPSTFAPDNVDRYLPSRDTSICPSVKEKKKKTTKELTIKIDNDREFAIRRNKEFIEERKKLLASTEKSSI